MPTEQTSRRWKPGPRVRLVVASAVVVGVLGPAPTASAGDPTGPAGRAAQEESGAAESDPVETPGPTSAEGSLVATIPHEARVRCSPARPEDWTGREPAASEKVVYCSDGR